MAKANAGMRGDKSGPVWQLATARGKNYITPEDVGEAIKAGATREDVWRDVLIAVDVKAAEDPSLCAFLALDRFGALSPKRTSSPERNGDE